jgi:uncharacterized membrane protein
MCNFSWHDDLVIFSFFAAIAGLLLLLTDKTNPDVELEAVDHALLMMIFAYWLVYCVAAIAIKFVQPEWEMLAVSIKLTGVLSYLLTFTCLLSLPLHRFAARQVEKG